MELELAWREPDLRLDQTRIEADPARGWVDVGAGAFQHGARLVVQEVDADLLEHGKSRRMDRFEFVAGDEVERRERQDRLAQGPGGASATLDRAPAPPAPGILRRRFGCHCRSSDCPRRACAAR